MRQRVCKVLEEMPFPPSDEQTLSEIVAVSSLLDARALRPISERFLSGSISAHVALLQMLTEAGLAGVAEAIAALEPAASNLAISSAIRSRMSELMHLFAGNRARCAEIARALDEQPDFYSDAESDAGRVAHYRALFETLVRDSPVASVAAYSLGRSDVLDEATAEVVAFLVERGLVDEGKAILQIGCGIGRFESALSPIVGSATGIDISAGMIAAAEERCAALPNVTLLVSSGLDLALFEDDRFDLVYAVDSFPYIVAVGPVLVETYFAEAARILKPHGDFLILNFSYRNSLELDKEEVLRLASSYQFEVHAAGETPFHLWDGAVFQLRKTCPRQDAESKRAAGSGGRN